MKALIATGEFVNEIPMRRTRAASGAWACRRGGGSRPGVLANARNPVKAAEINARRMENIVFAGAQAAIARIVLDDETLKNLREANPDVIEINLLSLN